MVARENYNQQRNLIFKTLDNIKILNEFIIQDKYRIISNGICSSCTIGIVFYFITLTLKFCLETKLTKIKIS